MSNIPVFTLNDGTKMPSVGMGCWMGTPGGEERVLEMCRRALKVGYRHFDTASGYANEKEVGQAIREAGIPRKDIYLTTKLPNTHHDRVLESFEESLKLLDCEYIDCYLLHWPQGTKDGVTLSHKDAPTFTETYKEMEKLIGTGKVRTIGVSNLSVRTLSELLAECRIVPAVNQVELHPCLPNKELKELCDKHNILLTAYSPLGRADPVFNNNSSIQAIARRLSATPAQVILSWAVQRGISVVPKSEDEGRMTLNITLVKLTEEDMEQINTLHRLPGMHKSLLTYHSDDGKVLGWTYEQLGWPMTKGGVAF